MPSVQNPALYRTIVLSSITKLIARPMLVIVFFISWGCSPSYESPDLSSQIVGEWDWIKTEAGGWSNQIQTPASEGHTEVIEFKNTGYIDTFTDSRLISTQPYKLVYRLNDPINPQSDSTLVLVIDEGTPGFFSISNDTLVISYLYVDGHTSFYKRKK